MKTEVQTNALVVGDVVEIFDTDGDEGEITKVFPYGFYEVNGEKLHHSSIRRKKEFSSVKTSTKR